MKWARVLAAMSAGAVIGAVFLGTGVAGSETSETYERVVRIYRIGPSEACGGDTCSGGTIEPITATFSSVGDPVRVVATVSLRYRTSIDDRAECQCSGGPAVRWRSTKLRRVPRR